MSTVLLTGANGVVGQPLRQRLVCDGQSYISVSRALDVTDLVDDANGHLRWDLQHTLDQSQYSQLKSANVRTLIHCAPIWLLPVHLNALTELGIRRIIAFSSSSVSSKKSSNDPSEQRLVQQLSSAEESLEKFCKECNVALTIFRPSMIYGYTRDQNVTHIAQLIQRFGFMMLVGQAKGLRQPVHADDLVEACLTVMDEPVSYGKTYHLAGGEALTYRAMVERILIGLNKRTRLIALPLGVFRLALKIAALFGKFSYTPEMADRMNQHLNYDNSDASNDFSYSPQQFLSQPERDLPLR